MRQNYCMCCRTIGRTVFGNLGVDTCLSKLKITLFDQSSIPRHSCRREVSELFPSMWFMGCGGRVKVTTPMLEGAFFHLHFSQLGYLPVDGHNSLFATFLLLSTVLFFCFI